MAYFSEDALVNLKLKYLGKNVKISEKASIQNPSLLSIGDNSRIDDFCVVSGNVEIGKNVHLAVYSHISGGNAGVVMEDFSGLAFGVHVVAESDDYTGESLTNPTVPMEYKKPICKKIRIGKHVIIGAQSVVLPGASIGEGSAIGALTLVNRTLPEWGVYSGVPARKLKERSQKILQLEASFLKKRD